MHVSLRVTRELAPLRTKMKLKVVKTSMRDTHETRTTFRVVHFSVQKTHLHLIVEADDKNALTDGLRALQIRIAKRLNALAKRKGRVFSDRYHARVCTTPSDTRAALAYVLLNARHHEPHRARSASIIDPCSSGMTFDGWSRKVRLPDGYVETEPIVATRSATTWLINMGWRKHCAPIAPNEVPGQKPRKPRRATRSAARR